MRAIGIAFWALVLIVSGWEILLILPVLLAGFWGFYAIIMACGWLGSLHGDAPDRLPSQHSGK